MIRFPKSVMSAVAAVALAASLSVSPLVATAQELSPEHLALARQYVDLTDKSKLFERVLLRIGVQAMRTMVQQNPEVSEEVVATIEDVLRQYREQKDDLFNQIARVYAVRLTPAELEVIIAFYTSEVGQKLATTNAEAADDLQSVMRIYEDNLSTEFYAKIRAALRDKGINV